MKKTKLIQKRRRQQQKRKNKRYYADLLAPYKGSIWPFDYRIAVVYPLDLPHWRIFGKKDVSKLERIYLFEPETGDGLAMLPGEDLCSYLSQYLWAMESYARLPINSLLLIRYISPSGQRLIYNTRRDVWGLRDRLELGQIRITQDMLFLHRYRWHMERNLIVLDDPVDERTCRYFEDGGPIEFSLKPGMIPDTRRPFPLQYRTHKKPIILSD